MFSNGVIPMSSSIHAAINDYLRSTGHSCGLGDMFLSHGVSLLAPDERQLVIQHMRVHDDFPEGNDPYGEHDFGAFNVMLNNRLRAFFFKIDVYPVESVHIPKACPIPQFPDRVKPAKPLRTFRIKRVVKMQLSKPLPRVRIKRVLTIMFSHEY